MDIDDSNSFVEVGWIRGSHGVKGEVKVISRTDFPEERFEKVYRFHIPHLFLYYLIVYNDSNSAIHH